MVRIPGKPTFPLLAIVTALGLPSPAAAVEAPSGVSTRLPACLIGLGSGDGSPMWSLLDVTANRSVDLDLADGAGLTVACGTLAAPKSGPAATRGPAGTADPSAKGDFGSL